MNKYVMKKSYRVFYLDENNQPKGLIEKWCNGQRSHSIFRDEGYSTEEAAEHVLNLWCKINNGTHGMRFVIIPMYCETCIKEQDSDHVASHKNSTADTSPFNNADKPSLCGLFD